MWIVWLIAAGVFFIGEIITVGFLIFWFGVGSLFAMVTSFIFPDNILLQSIVFLVSSTILILCTKPIVNKYISKKSVPTNVYSVVGKIGIVTKPISFEEPGQVKVDGETWTAVSKYSSTIEKDTEVTVHEIDGVKLIVSPVPVAQNK